MFAFHAAWVQEKKKKTGWERSSQTPTDLTAENQDLLGKASYGPLHDRRIKKFLADDLFRLLNIFLSTIA